MPSPIAHLAVGALIAARSTDGRIGWRNKLPLTLLVLFFSMAPDLDSVVGIIAGDFGAYHNQASHSLLFGLVFCLLATPVAVRLVKGLAPRAMFALIYACYALHVLMDTMTYGRGVKLFWPITDERFMSPVLIFYGVRWSDDLSSSRHLITVANEVAFALVVLGFAYYLHQRRKRNSVG